MFVKDQLRGKLLSSASIVRDIINLDLVILQDVGVNS
tara:strand:+ start:166 stop:276 length:111 start_codon:yes stop_codon:yes gene_type:complete